MRMRDLFIVLPAAGFQCGAGAAFYFGGWQFFGSQLFGGALMYALAWLRGWRRFF